MIATTVQSQSMASFCGALKNARSRSTNERIECCGLQVGGDSKAIYSAQFRGMKTIG
jgi:hypothetical protein